jgi:hypothetical protein
VIDLGGGATGASYRPSVAGLSRPGASPRRPYLARTHVELAPIREAFESSGLTVGEFARRMGMVRVQPNVDQARRALGLRPDSNSRDGRRGKPREFVSVDMATRMADALELAPVDLGF